MYSAIDKDVYIYRLEAAVEEIGTLVNRFRFSKSLIVFDKYLDPEFLEKLKMGFSESGVEYLLLEVEEVFFHLIDEGFRTCLFEKVDSLIGIGGVAALDCAKGINLLRFNGGNIQKYTNSQKRRNPGSGLFCVPMIDGTDEELLLSLKTKDNTMQESFRVECYCNYHIKLIKNR